LHAFEERRRPVQIWRWAPFRGRQRAAVDPCKIDVRSSTLRCSTISFPSSHLGEGAPLLTEEGTFESCGGSQPTTSDRGPDLSPPTRKRPPLRSKKSEMLLPSSSGKDARLSSGRRGFESRWQCHIHLPVAQLDEQRATNAKVCRFESCREGQSSVYRSAGEHSVCGEGRVFKSCRTDQGLSRAGRSVRRRTLNPFRQVRFLCAQPIWRGTQAARVRSAKPDRRVRLPLSLPILRAWTKGQPSGLSQPGSPFEIGELAER
jgi:hypothetical protein